MAKTKSIDLDFLKRIIGELENMLEAANKIREDEGDVKEYVMTLHKAAGLASGSMQESALLISDINAHIMSLQSVGSKASSNSNDILEKLLGSIKSGTSN